jgi:lipopolysaccharide/colanic/teichoic acid biosynthesis glycosyltransferase
MLNRHEAVGVDLPSLQRQLVPGFRRYFVVKRATDLVVAVLLAVLTAPVWLTVALVIRLSSRGPVLFRQVRIGSRRQADRETGEERWVLTVFTVLKFRSMVVDADESVHREHIRRFASGELASAPRGPAFKIHNDPRVTAVGRILRRTSIDELPQLWNVLKGQMSLVGPRPVPPYEVALYRPADYQRFAAVPGLTGLWQVSGRGDRSFPDMLALDLELVERRSLWLEAAVLLKTIPAVVRGGGAA